MNSILTGGGTTILANSPAATYSGNSLRDFQKFATKHKDKLLIGYFSYDLAYQLYNIPQTAIDDLQIPQIHFQAYDHWQTDVTLPTPTNIPHHSTNFQPTITKEQYDAAYRKIQHHIREGDIYQINLTHRLEATSNLPPEELFYRTIAQNPVEFGAYINTPDFQIISASPERFIRIKDRQIETGPVKGTRPRGKTPEKDAQQKKSLIESEKEAAELNMITDLLRNDLGKIAKTGTVKVEGHRLISECPTVWHTYSRITAQLATTPLEALISMSPGGSITGCPKKRAIEIIDELEPTTRSVYTGTIGYIAPQDRTHNLPSDLDFNIAIRTIIKKGQKLYLQVGGGIVLDSTSESEYEETLHKAASFMNIL